ncbi:MAG: hypothetical protein HN820_04780 [Candidatus Marinimicrobia bacterium]|jgi:DNA-binding beta-propeller fold protein YncE|nr:hypothetical protein [Candidatus Neomarinimicrobiota bacterium]MBT6869979.1 hypothetical protein [Candidatus Neomarinimicrobiota bacterium]MBT7377451.1 hypothetical protein [Candidatus Neomarinimicrobiota bacterium]
MLNMLLPNNVYVALQMFDQVGVINMDSLQQIDMIDITLNDNVDCSLFSDEMGCNMVSDCEWVMNMCMESDDGGMNMGNNTPHFIAIDETNGYWFVSTISSGYVGRYSLESNIFIDKVFVDDSPAILTLDETNQKIYCSRMMPMGGMMDGAESTIIQEIDYSGTSIINSNEFIIPSPAPHGISINTDGSEVYVSSNTADWLYKIIPETGEVIGVVMDTEISNPSEIETHRLKPIQCLSVSDSLLFVTCSGGIWVDPWTGQQEQISGKVQLWNSNSMSLIDTYEFDWNSSPWHIINSPVFEKVYVALSGDQLYEGSAGVVELDYSNSILSQSWFTSHEIFQSLHGIDISPDGETIFVSGRADGHLHIIDTEMGELQNSIPLSTNPSMVMAGGVATVKNLTSLLGDVNNDFMLDILDIVLMVNYILNSEVIFTQVADMNGDGIIDILDIVNLVNIILQ